MPEQRNLFAVGAEALLNSLAEREMRKRDAEYQAKKDARQAEIDAQNKRMVDLQISTAEQQQADRKAKTEQDAADRQQKNIDAARRDALQQAYALNPNPLIAAQIADLGGTVPEGPKKEKPTLHEVNGVLYDVTDPAHPKRVVGTERPVADPNAPPKDDPTLPNGVKSWLATKAGTGFSMAEWQKYVVPVHPRADLAKAREWLKRAAGGIDLPLTEGGAIPPPPGGGAPAAGSPPPTASPTAVPPRLDLEGPTVPSPVATGPKEGEVRPIPGHPGQTAVYRNGKWIAQ